MDARQRYVNLLDLSRELIETAEDMARGGWPQDAVDETHNEGMRLAIEAGRVELDMFEREGLL
jgi:hypothetical protein